MNDIAAKPPVDEAAPPPEGPRVLQVVPALGEGGVERGTLDIARVLVAEGWQALVASSGGGGEAELREIGGSFFRLPLHAKNPLVMRANIGRLQRLIRSQNVDLVHARSRAPAWSAYFAAKRCKVPFVTTFHGVYEGSEQWLKRRYNAIMARGQRVIAISQYVADHVRERYDVGPDRLRVIPRGIDLPAFDPESLDPARKAALAERWRLPEGVRVVMLPGRVTRIKGHQLLLRAIERMSRRDFICLMVGSVEPRTSYVSEVEALIGALGLSEVVRMVGTCNDMPAALALADFVVVPSIGPEGFGRVSVEAQAMGKAVIAADIGGLSETVMPAATGWLVPPNDASELAQALELALAMPDDARARLATRARRFVARNFTLEQMGRRTLAVYRELLDDQSAAELDDAIAPPATRVAQRIA
jgi:glycosyltransferase involved in cell wall biosynthesis